MAFAMLLATPDAIRVIPYSLPIVTICSAVTLAGLVSLRTIFRRGVSFAVSFVIVFSSFVGLWATRYVPVQVYDARVSSDLIGEHSPHSLRVGAFISGHVQYRTVDAFLSDDNDLLALLLPWTEYRKVPPSFSEGRDTLSLIGLTAVGQRQSLLVAEFRNFNTYSYSNPVQRMDQAKAEAAATELSFSQTFGKIYSDGANTLWKN
jgi:hypothetical protein